MNIDDGYGIFLDPNHKPIFLSLVSQKLGLYVMLAIQSGHNA